MLAMLLVAAPLFIGAVRADHDDPWDHLGLPDGDVVLWCIHVRIPPSIEQYCTEIRPPGSGDPKISITPSVEVCVTAQVVICVDTMCDRERDVCVFPEGACASAPYRDVCVSGVPVPYCSTIVRANLTNEGTGSSGFAEIVQWRDDSRTYCERLDAALP